MASDDGLGGEIDTVFSVCTVRDSVVWSYASKRIVECISANRYVVLVPDAEVDEFRRKSHSLFEVVPESTYLQPYVLRLQEAVLANNARSRYGWYLQQLLKLAYLNSLKDDGVILIWDADTVPLRRLHFLGGMGEILYYKGTEFHSPYFPVISNLLGMERMVSFSFIAQCFALKTVWARDFFSYIEKKHSCHWVDALLASVNWDEPSGFSEYETLGTFISRRYPGAWLAIDDPWQRYGKGVIGEVTNLDSELGRHQLVPYAFASFENWDRPYGLHSYTMRTLLRSYHAIRIAMASLNGKG